MFAWFNPPLQVSKLLKRKIHIFFFYLTSIKKKKRKNKILTQKFNVFDISTLVSKIPSILIYHQPLRNPKYLHLTNHPMTTVWNRTKRERKKKKKREREKNNSRKSSRAAFRKVGFFTPLHERCILNVAWRKLFQKDRKCAREWTTAPKLNITSQSFVECAAIYSVSLADPVYN